MPDTATCPLHNCALHPKETQFGTRWACPIEGCTVCWWGEERTTPADKETRAARMAAHKAFDKLWKGPGHPMERPDAYEWLQRTFELPPEKAHIGLLTKQQCEDLCYAVQRWLGKDRERPKQKRSKYPRTMPPKRMSVSKLWANNGSCRCEIDGETFKEDEVIVMQETQTGPMRGDDDVKFWHERCYPKKGA